MSYLEACVAVCCSVLQAFLMSYLVTFLMSHLVGLLTSNEYPPATVALLALHAPGGLASGMRHYHPLNMIHFLFWHAMANCGARWLYFGFSPPYLTGGINLPTYGSKNEKKWLCWGNFLHLQPTSCIFSQLSWANCRFSGMSCHILTSHATCEWVMSHMNK